MNANKYCLIHCLGGRVIEIWIIWNRNKCLLCSTYIYGLFYFFSILHTCAEWFAITLVALLTFAHKMRWQIATFSIFHTSRGNGRIFALINVCRMGEKIIHWNFVFLLVWVNCYEILLLLFSSITHTHKHRRVLGISVFFFSLFLFDDWTTGGQSAFTIFFFYWLLINSNNANDIFYENCFDEILLLGIVADNLGKIPVKCCFGRQQTIEWLIVRATVCEMQRE